MECYTNGRNAPGNNSSTTKPESPHSAEPSIYLSYSPTPGLSDTASPSRSLTSTPVPSSAYSITNFSESAEAGPKSCSPLNFSWPYSAFSSRSNLLDSSYSRDCGRYPSCRSKNNSSVRNFSFDNSFVNNYSSQLDGNGNISTPSSLNTVSASHHTCTSTVPIVSCSTNIQSTDIGSQEDKNSNITCYSSDGDLLISPATLENESVISSLELENESNVLSHDDGCEKVLPDCSSGMDTGVQSGSDSGSCQNIEHNNLEDVTRVEKRQFESYDISCKKRKHFNLDQTSDQKHRKSSIYVPVSHSKNASSVSTTTHYRLGTQESIPEKSRNISRPPYSYVALIQLAILSSPEKKCTLPEIYRYIETNFEYYVHCKVSWRNSIRHNLSLNKCFFRLPKDGGRERKGGYWCFDPAFNNMFQKNNMRRRVRMKRPEKLETCSQSRASSATAPIQSSFSRPFPHSCLSASDFVASGYRSVNSNERNWSLSHITSSMRHSSRASLSPYSSCQRVQTESLHVGYMQTVPREPIVTCTQTSIPLPAAHPAHNYASPTAFPGHYPSELLRETSYSTQPSHRYHPYKSIF